MKNSPTIIRRSDYRPSQWLCPKIDLKFELHLQNTLVTSELTLTRNPERSSNADHSDIRFEGHDSVKLLSITINSHQVPDFALTKKADSLVIAGSWLEQKFSAAPTVVVKTISTLNPLSNTSLQGLYVSSGQFYTQCEAEGFRRITWALDRPDIMSVYTVRIEASIADFSVLLSNGNLVDSGTLDKERHYAVWHDPFPKPSYLFALVAGNLECRETKIERPGFKPALLQVWVRSKDLPSTEFALSSLEKAIQWDRQRYGLELDLDRFMIVAVDDFNMGAMENKGLNIFNSVAVLAQPTLATDADYSRIEAIVGHEYFHNWTGNRVTCRDWFQLTLKEGLTVFRDQEFSTDMAASSALGPTQAASSRAISRIREVVQLRRTQFPEDSGAMSHPIRPEQYADIDNFYTPTVYEKGAEVVRMIQTIVGREGFAKGLALYFQRHDGQAVTCDDFLTAMQDANQINLEQFANWYSQAGTPTLEFTTGHSASLHNVRELNFKQKIKLEQVPFDMPIVVQWYSKDWAGKQQVLRITQRQQSFQFPDLPEGARVSVGCGFSAPIRFSGDTDLRFSALYDPDPFNRWDACQELAMKAVLADYTGQNDVALAHTSALLDALSEALKDQHIEPGYLALLLQLPEEAVLAESISELQPSLLRECLRRLHRRVAFELRDYWIRLFEINIVQIVYCPEPTQMGKRAAQNIALFYLCQLNDTAMAENTQKLLERTWQSADNLTARIGVLAASRYFNPDLRNHFFDLFERTYADHDLVLNKGLALLSSRWAILGDQPLVNHVAAIFDDPSFNRRNPNRLRALIGNFLTSNLAEFHHESGLGYAFFERAIVEIDKINPSVAARFARTMDRWQAFSPSIRSRMQQTITNVLSNPGLSVSLAEILSSSKANTNHNL